MAESLYLPETDDKASIYEALLPQLVALTEDETDQIANMANVASALKEAFSFFWVGFYRVIGEELVLGPFQGPLACTRIARGRGVCGIAWRENRTICVPDVDLFPGHIACSAFSRSEIVVPLRKGNEVFAILDIDSNRKSAFDDKDIFWLEKLVESVRW